MTKQDRLHEIVDELNFGGTTLTRSRYDRILAAHEDLLNRIRKAGSGPRNAAAAVDARIFRAHGPHLWTRADLAGQARAVQAARESHPDYQEWVSLSAEMDRQIARNRELGRPLLAYTDADWDGAP